LNFLEIQKELLDLGLKYNELIMAVDSKFPNETRHETALRYIRAMETIKLEGMENGKK